MAKPNLIGDLAIDEDGDLFDAVWRLAGDSCGGSQAELHILGVPAPDGQLVRRRALIDPEALFVRPACGRVRAHAINKRTPERIGQYGRRVVSCEVEHRDAGLGGEDLGFGRVKVGQGPVDIRHELDLAEAVKDLLVLSLCGFAREELTITTGSAWDG